MDLGKLGSGSHYFSPRPLALVFFMGRGVLNLISGIIVEAEVSDSLEDEVHDKSTAETKQYIKVTVLNLP